MIKNIDISEDGNEVEIFIELEEFCRTKQIPKFDLTVDDIIKILSERKITVSNMISGPVSLINWDSSSNSGTWCFSTAPKVEQVFIRPKRKRSPKPKQDQISKKPPTGKPRRRNTRKKTTEE